MHKRESANPESCQSYRYENYYLLFDRKERLLREWYTADSAYALSFITRGNPSKNTITFYPGAFLDSIDNILSTIDSKIEQVDGYTEVSEERKNIERSMERLQVVIAGRTKEPVTFRETFIDAFLDIFKR